MRVLAVTPNYPPGSRVGAWLATHQFMARLVEVGHSVTAVALGSTSTGWTLDGVTVETCRRGRSWIAELAREHDVVVSHYGDGGVGERFARKAGRPSVQFVHGYIRSRPNYCQLLVFNAEATRAMCRNPDPSIVCHPWTDPAAHATTPGDRVTLVNLSEPKGVRLFEKLARSMPHIPFLGVRGGYGRQWTIGRPNVDEVPTTRNMRDDVWCRTRVLLMPSQYETWGMVGVEAMASGIPVIASPTPGLVEALGDAGRFIPVDEPHAWQAAIEELMSDDDAWQAASEKARKRSAELAAGDDRDRFVEALERVVDEFGSAVKVLTHGLEIR